PLCPPVRPLFLPPLLHLRLLAHQPWLPNGGHRSSVWDHVPELCLVPLGSGNSRLQSPDSTRPDVSTRLLGTHRVRLRTLLPAPQTSRIHRHRLARIAGNIFIYANPVASPHKN